MQFQEELLLPLRQRQTSIPGRLPVEEFYSDRSRIIYASSFRRLQQKAQVFSLEPNSSVRTRLTHSLEVADIGRTLANRIGKELLNRKIIENSELIPQIVAVVENACLLHDIGNPPFGHFGEAAIRDWVNKNLSQLAQDAGIGGLAVSKFKYDFEQFDGNPQGLRVITRLHCERDENGLNLTYPTLLCGIKYPRMAGQPEEKKTQKKAGYFLSEEPVISKICKEMGRDYSKKYPLAYIMEAADDISYCLSDISDGIEKRILTSDGFLDSFRQEWEKKYGTEEMPVSISAKHKDYFNLICVDWSRAIVNETVEYYINHWDSFLAGEEKDIISNCQSGKVLDVIKDVSRKKLYRSLEAESIELSGYSIITGLLESFSELVRLKREKFELLTDEDKSPQNAGIDLQWRIFNRLSNRILKSYKMQLKEYKNSDFSKRNSLGPDDVEWWLRVHMIIDHISGMTDAYALETYQMLKGVIRF